MSSAVPAIPLFGDAYLADTRHLSLEEHGAYLQLIMIAWRIEGCCLPDDDARLARMLGVTAARWRKLKPVVMAFWTLENGTWKQARLTKERAFVEEKRAKNSASARARWAGQDTENAKVNGCERISERNAPPPPPKKEGSVANATVGMADDPVKELFDFGVKLLMEAGQTEKQARSLIGKWRKPPRTDGDVLTALIDCRARHISNPVEWLQKRFGGVKYVSASGYEYRGSLRDIIREAERRADWSIFHRAKGDLADAPPPKRQAQPPPDPNIARLVGQATQSLRVGTGRAQ